MTQPGVRNSVLPALAVGQAAAAERRRGTKDHAASLRMQANNPMANSVTRAKMAASLMGRTFLARGGKGQTTWQQELLHAATLLPMEHAIATAAVKGQFPSLPNAYMVDLADPARMLAIEVDGKTHRLRKWQFLDARKTEVLRALGWSVLRFWNEEVENQLPAVLERIRKFSASE